MPAPTPMPTPTQMPAPTPTSPAGSTLLSVRNASYGNKDAAKSHNIQVSNAGTIKVSLDCGKNDNYTIALQQNGVTSATKSSSNGAATLTYSATTTGAYVIVVEKTSNGNASYSLSVTIE